MCEAKLVHSLVAKSIVNSAGPRDCGKTEFTLDDCFHLPFHPPIERRSESSVNPSCSSKVKHRKIGLRQFRYRFVHKYWHLAAYNYSSIDHVNITRPFCLYFLTLLVRSTTVSNSKSDFLDCTLLLVFSRHPTNPRDSTASALARGESRSAIRLIIKS